MCTGMLWHQLLLASLCGCLPALLGQFIDLARHLEVVPRRVTTLAGLDTSLCLVHPLAHSLVAILGCGGDLRHLENLTFCHDAGWDGLLALLQANVGRSLGHSTLHVKDLAEAACLCRVLASHRIATSVVGALSAISWAACLRLVCNCAWETDDT